MLGTILFVDEATGTAIVRADDGKRYRFPASDWPEGSPLAAGVRVDFDAEADRAIAPVPISEAIASVVAAAPSADPDPQPPVAEPEPMLEPESEPEPEPETAAPMTAAPTDPELVSTADDAAALPQPVRETALPDGDDKAATPPPELPPAGPEAETPLPPGIRAADAAEGLPPGRPLGVGAADVPDYVSLSEPDPKAGGMSAIFVIGGVVLLLALAALAYMMWDNAETAGFADGSAAESGETVTLYAQEDLPVRNVAAMTNATVLGRIARGDRVTGVEVEGSADANSRWLRLDGGNRFVPMTGLGPSAPPVMPAEPAGLPPPLPPVLPADGVIDGQANGPGGANGATGEDRVGPIPPPARTPPPARPSPPPQRPFTPSSPQDTRPVGPQRPTAPPPPGDPRETQPVR